MAIIGEAFRKIDLELLYQEDCKWFVYWVKKIPAGQADLRYVTDWTSQLVTSW